MNSMNSAGRISDYQILVGHLWQCPECREAFLSDPRSMMAGLKLTREQTATLQEFAKSPYMLIDRLQGSTGLAEADFQTAVAHPRARLRHLGVRKAHSEQ